MKTFKLTIGPQECNDVTLQLRNCKLTSSNRVGEGRSQRWRRDWSKKTLNSSHSVIKVTYKMAPVVYQWVGGYNDTLIFWYLAGSHAIWFKDDHSHWEFIVSLPYWVIFEWKISSSQAHPMLACFHGHNSPNSIQKTEDNGSPHECENGGFHWTEDVCVRRTVPQPQVGCIWRSRRSRTTPLWHIYKSCNLCKYVCVFIIYSYGSNLVS